MSFEPREYLRHMLAEADYLLRSSQSLSRDQFRGDETLKRAFVRSLEIIGEAAKKVPDEFRAEHPQVEWRAMAGTRDRLIHGWFIYEYEGAILQWHYGYWDSNSSLILRAPQAGLTFVVLANTNMLSRAYGLGVDANVMRSDVARLFVESFVLGDEPFPMGM